jgi:hypothetical protein
MSSQTSVGRSTGPDLRATIQLLDHLLVAIPSADDQVAPRAEAIKGCLRRLNLFGVDGENLVRYGMPHRAALAIYVTLITSEPSRLAQLIDVNRWRTLLHVNDAMPSSDGDASNDALSQVRAQENVAHVPHQLDRWAMNASLADVLNWVPPSDEEWRRISLESSSIEDVSEAYLWLWRRNVVDELDRWSVSSLHLEYRWQNQQQVGLFSELALGADGPAPDLLNAAIARRAVEPQDSSETDAVFWALQDAAVEYLKQGKFAAAVALFEFHHGRFPNDARALNNMGFCLMPTSPSKALHWLEVAMKYGYADVSINTYNQCCCLERLNRADEALDKAESYWQRLRPPTVFPGYLWTLTEGGWELSGDDDPESQIIELALRAATALALPDRIARWEQRREQARVSS